MQLKLILPKFTVPSLKLFSEYSIPWLLCYPYFSVWTLYGYNCGLIPQKKNFSRRQTLQLGRRTKRFLLLKVKAACAPPPPEKPLLSQSEFHWLNKGSCIEPLICDFFYHLILCMRSEVHLRGEGVCLNNAKLFLTFPLTPHASIRPSQTESRTIFAMGNISLWSLYNKERNIWAKPPVMSLNKTTSCLSFTAILMGWKNWKR